MERIFKRTKKKIQKWKIGHRRKTKLGYLGLLSLSPWKPFTSGLHLPCSPLPSRIKIKIFLVKGENFSLGYRVAPTVKICGNIQEECEVRQTCILPLLASCMMLGALPNLP